MSTVARDFMGSSYSCTNIVTSVPRFDSSPSSGRVEAQWRAEVRALLLCEAI